MNFQYDIELGIIKWLQNSRNDFFDIFFNVFSYTASVFAVLILAAVLFFLYSKKFGLAFLITEGMAAVVTWILKNIIKRPRPFATYLDIANLGKETGFSMPSGHSITAAVIAVFLLYMAFKHYKTKGRVICSVLAFVYLFLIAIDRMYLGVHYLTDVLAGFGLGILVCVIASLTLPPIFEFVEKMWRQKHPTKNTDEKQN